MLVGGRSGWTVLAAPDPRAAELWAVIRDTAATELTAIAEASHAAATAVKATAAVTGLDDGDANDQEDSGETDQAAASPEAAAAAENAAPEWDAGEAAGLYGELLLGGSDATWLN